MTKKEMSEIILAAKRAKGVTWAELGKTVGLGEVFLASCAHGENALPKEIADRFGEALDLSPEVRAALVLHVRISSWPARQANVPPGTPWLGNQRERCLPGASGPS